MKKPFVLTASLEDYLEAIKTLIDSHGHAHTNSIANMVGVKMPSVTNAMGILRDNGYVNYALNTPVTLTALGEKAALRVKRRHTTLAAFLHDALLVSEEDSDTMACEIEHVITDELLTKLTVLTEVMLSDEPAFVALRERLAALKPEAGENDTI